MPAAERVRIAAAQYPLEAVASLGAWRAKIARWVAEGAATGARLLVFPEYGAVELAATRGRDVAGDPRATLAAVAELAPELDRTFAALAGAHGVHILAPSGPARLEAGGYGNVARLFAPGGRSGAQAKLIMTPFERDWGIAAGRRLAVFDTDLARIGIAICYDAEFPLLVRAQAEAGADLLLVPSCTERLSGYRRVRAAAAARALESGIAVAVAATVGEAPWSPVVDRNVGSASVLVPPECKLSLTGVLAEGALDTPGWVTAEIDFAALDDIRRTGEMRNRSDWALQPGAAPLAAAVEVVDLR